MARQQATGSRTRVYIVAGQAVDVPVLAPGLHVVATPIGNLADITLRALGTLAAADTILCEDTRVTSRLTRHYGITTPLRPYHDHNAARVRPAILESLSQGAAIALVSDAGTPLVSDPGYRLVAEAISTGIAVHPVPGPSALLAALVVAGLPSDRFLFVGFLPARAGARAEALGELAAVPASLVVYESPRRLADTLAAMADILGNRPAVVARELTKLHEEARRGRLGDLAAGYAQSDPPKGEVVIVIGPPDDVAVPAPGDVDRMLVRALANLSVKEAAASIAASTGLPRRHLYARALELRAMQRDE